MTKFIDVSNNDTKEVKKETVFTHLLTNGSGFIEAKHQPKDFETIKYLGNCAIDGDMFAIYDKGEIGVYKGTKGDEFNQ